MSMKINHQLCSPETLKKEYPMADSLKALKEKRDEGSKRFLQENLINSSY